MPGIKINQTKRNEANVPRPTSLQHVPAPREADGVTPYWYEPATTTLALTRRGNNCGKWRRLAVPMSIGRVVVGVIVVGVVDYLVVALHVS